jgi:hypothetical protein
MLGGLGEWDATNADAFRKGADATVEGSEVMDRDFSPTTFMNRAGVGAPDAWRNSATDRHGVVRLLNSRSPSGRLLLARDPLRAGWLRRSVRSLVALTSLWGLLGVGVAQSTVTNVITGSIAVPGERDVFTFGLTADARFYFDSLTNVSGLQWSLGGPSGTVVANRAFTSSDSQSIGDPTLRLPAGNYTLTVEDPGGATNAYAFRLVNLAEASLLVPGTVVTNNLAPANQSDFYQFTASAGDQFYFQRVARVGLPNTWWRLLDPYGNQVFGQGFTDVGTPAAPLTLPTAGTYTLLIEGYVGDPGSGSYAFSVVPEGHVPPPVFTGTPLQLGDVVSSNLVANTTNAYVFTLANSARVVLDTQTNSPSLNWTLRGPSGLVVNPRVLNSSDWANNFGPFDLPSGSYQLRVQGTANSPYVFRLLDLAAAAVFTPGTPVTNTLSPASATAAYRFTIGSAGRYFFDAQSSGGLPNAYWRLIDPYDNVVFITSLGSDRGPLSLGSPGTYTLLVEGYYLEPAAGTNVFNVVPVSDGLQALTLGTTVSGAITAPGQHQQYTFTLPASARLYFDGLTNLYSLRWYLDGPTGNVVNNAGFNSDSILGPLSAGSYTLTVFANNNNDTTGTYQFRLFDLATAAALTPGTAVSDTLNPANSTKAYQFTLATAGRYFFDYQSSSSLPNASWRLLDARGAVVFNTGLGNNQGPLNLLAGAYTLLVEGYIAEPGSGNYTFNILTVTDRSQTLTLGTTVSGAITAPGQHQQYTFTLAAPTSLYLDSLTNNAQLRWSLDGPTGRLVNNWAFGTGDNNLGPVPAGNYVLAVFADNNNDVTSDYQFRMLDLATAAPTYFGFSGATSNPPPPQVRLQAGWPVTGAVVPGRAFSICAGAVADQPVTNLVITATGAFSTNLSLGGGGPYALTFPLSTGATPGSAVVFTATATDAIGRLSAPATLTLNVVSPTGQASPVVYYSRGGSPDGQLWVAALDGSFDVPLMAGEQPRVSPDGRQLAFHRDNATYSRANLYVVDLQTGNLRMLLSNPDYIVGYGWTPDSARLVFDYSCDVEQINLDGGNRRQLFGGNCYDDAPAVNALDGRVAFHNTVSGGGIGLVNADGSGKQFIANTVVGDVWAAWSPDGQWISFQDGTNYSKIHPDGSGLIQLTAVPAVGDGFNGPGSWTPDGSHLIVAGKYGGANGLYSVATDGSRTITLIPTAVGAAIDFVGSVVAVPATSVPFVGAPLGETLAISGSVAPANGAAAWKFAAQAGQFLTFQAGSQSGFTVQGQPRWLLQDPLGNVLFENWFTTVLNPLTAPYTGDYTLVVYGWINETAPNGSFNLLIQSTGSLPAASTLPGTPMVLGTVISNSVTVGQSLNYTFSLAAPARLIFDSLTANDQIRWSLGTRDADLVSNRSFQASDSADISDATVAVPAGQYQLAVSSTATGTNTFQFRLLNLTSATPFTPGTVVSNTLSPANSTALHQFSGTAGDRYYFDGQPTSGFSYAPYCRLYGPLGNVIQNVYSSSDLDTFSLPQTGVYTLTVEGRVYDTHASGSYAFNLVPETYPTNTLVIGNTITATIPVPGQRQVYTFTLPSAATLYFDALTNSDFSWRLDAPWGQVIDWRSFGGSDSADISNPLLPLGAGDYTLTVGGSGFVVTGTYQFRLLNVTNTIALTPGTPVGNTLTPANSTVFYRFNGNAGDRYYFDGQTGAGFSYYPYCRIYGPLGNVIQTVYANNDLDTFSLPQTGTYLLTVEGRVYDTHASGTYAFNLVPETYPTNALAIGNTITGTVPILGQRQAYAFTLPSPATLYFDALTNSDFYWRLDTSWGQVVDWRSFGSSDSVEISNPLLPLAAGDYTLSVAGNNFAVTGTYQFRLLNVTNTIAFTPGTVVGNTLAPASSTVFYQFSGNAGDRYYFDGQPTSGFTYAPYCRLYGPLGNMIQGVYSSSDLDTFSLPQTGPYLLTVEGRVYDTHASGTYAFNLVPNPVVPPQPLFSTNAAPDLLVTGVAVTPGTLQSGGSATVHWTDVNAGNEPTSGSFVDRVTIRNAANLVLADGFLPYNEGDAGNGPIGSGAGRARQLAVTLPDGTNSVGTLQVIVATDAQNAIAESDEANNSASASVSATLASYPDLLVTGLRATPATGWLPGSVVTLDWRLTNSGAGMAATNWVDSVVVRNTNTAQVILSATTNYTMADAGNGPLAPGDFRARSLAFTIPAGANAYGAFAITVTADNANQVFEYTAAGTAELNNTAALAVISAPDLVPTGLTVAPGGTHHSGDTLTLSWTDQNNGTVDLGSVFYDGVVVVNTTTAETLLSTSVSYNPAVPGNGAISPGGSRTLSTTFRLPDGPRGVGTLQVTIHADAFGQLTELNASGTAEANNTLVATATSVIAAYPDLQVINLNVQPGTLASGTNVTIRWQDTNSGSATAPSSWYDRVTIVNTNSGVTLLDTTLFYDANTLGTLTNGIARDRVFNFTLPNGVNAVGHLRFTVTADTLNSIFEYNPGGTGESNNTASVVVASSIAPYPDLQVISLDVQPAALGSGTNLTIHWQDTNTGNAPAAASWLDRVTIVNTNAGLTLLDTTVQYDTNVLGILTNGTARDRSISFTLPYTTNGAGHLRFTVAADSLNNVFEYNAGGTGESNNSTAIVRVSTLTPLPDLVITGLSAPASALTDHPISVQFHLANQGLLGTDGSFLQRVFISDTPVAGSGVFAGVSAFSGSLGIGEGADSSVTLQAPSVPGAYWLIAQTDASDNVLELSEANNFFVGATPITIQPAYTATVTADVHRALANTPIPMHGLATLGGSGLPAASVPITIHVQVRGTDRTYTVLTAADGTFTNTFRPLPNEAGDYQLAAAFPNVANPPTQDTFTLIGMNIVPIGLVSVTEGTGVTNLTRLNNLSDVPLTALSASVVTNSPNLALTVSLDTNALGSFAGANLQIGVTVLNPSVLQSAVVIRVTSAEGATADLTIFVRVQPLLPQLSSSPVSLSAAMLRGTQTPVAFTLSNKGGVPTGPLDVLLPGLPWLSLASPSQLPPLAPGSNTVITLLLHPASDLPFGDYNGTVVARSTNAALSVSFTFHPISDSQGSMLVTAEDEYTYFAAGSPRVTNALVVLSDALSGTPVVTNYTGADGTVLLTNLTENYYIVHVRATNHNAFRESALVVAGQATNITAFLTRQTVSYSFTVVPTTVQDAYIFQVESTFETQVPVPVVTIEPASMDLSQYPGTEFQVLFTVSNHGLIDAADVKLSFPSTTVLQLTPLVSDLGKLKANTSLTVPVMVKRTPAPAPKAARKTEGPPLQEYDYLSGQCSMTASVLWNYLCGPNVVDKSTAFYVFDSTGCDLVALYRQVYDLVPDSPGPGPGLTSDAFFDYLESLNPVTDFEPPPGYHFECKSAPPLVAGTLGGASAPKAKQGAPQLMDAGNNSVCAKVQIRLDQKGVLTRDAFKATLEISNEDTSPLQNVRVDLQITDAHGALVNTNFAITPAVLSGLSAVDGSGTLPASSDGTATWTLIPTLAAAPTNGAALYLVGGTLSYSENGSDITVPLAPAPIQVFPQPELVVRYFHDRDVFADDPFTPEIEPSIPYSLAAQVNNVGFGAARSLSITSSKPQIVENLKGLLIDFTLLGTQLENQQVTSALDVNFGSIDPGTNKTARWLFTSSVQGSFTNFSASFSQVDQFGKPRLSLVRSVEIHELNHIVDAGGPFADGRPDFLVNDASDPDHLPDTLYLSDGSTNAVVVVTNAAVTGTLGGGNLAVTLTSAPRAGWTYFRFPDPGQGQYRLTRVVRSDTSEVPFGTNAWTTDRFLRGGDQVPIHTNQVHLLDYNSTGNYTLFYVATTSAPDTIAPASAVTAMPASSPLSFAVQWSGTDNAGGSGIALYDLYVSVNGGAFTPWLTNTTVTAALYSGVANGHYAFFSRATDAAGNQEAVHATADAQTTVSQAANTPPSILPISLQTVAAGALFTLNPSATDGDLPAQTLTWGLLPGAPAGALISAGNGHVIWQTGPSDAGTTNAFALVVTDNGSPSLSATQSFNVVVTRANHRPVIVPPPAVVAVNEQTLLDLQLGASDPDPGDTLTWQLGPAAPAGLALNAGTGRLTWTPTEAQGPGSYLVRVMVRDSGTPSLSDTNTFLIAVNEVNLPPSLGVITNQTAFVLGPLVVTNIVSDSDSPANGLTFSFAGVVPSGARINSTNGLFTWTPSRAQAGTTNTITVLVTDDGAPPLSDSQSFDVIVGQYVEATMGAAVVPAGQAGSVAISVDASTPITNVSFTLELTEAGLTNLSLAAPAPPLAQATLQQISPSRFQIDFQTLAGQTLVGDQNVATLQFATVAPAPSAFVGLRLSHLSAGPTLGSTVPTWLTDDGRVTLVNVQPLLEVEQSGTDLQLTIHGEVGSNLSVLSTPNLTPPVNWSGVWTGTLSNLSQVITLPMTDAARFYRAVHP